VLPPGKSLRVCAEGTVRQMDRQTDRPLHYALTARRSQRNKVTVNDDNDDDDDDVQQR